MKNSVLQHKQFSSKTKCMIIQLLMQLMGKARVKTCDKFNAIAARNTAILLLTVQKNLAPIVKILGILSKNEKSLHFKLNRDKS